MNQPAETIDIDLTYDYLEEHLEDDCKCESVHVDADGTTLICSIEVVARKRTSCGRMDFLICLNSYNRNLLVMSSGHRCNCCMLPASECWSVIPV